MIALTIGFLMDLCFGDPRWMPHPIRLIGHMIEKGEKIVRRLLPQNQRGEFIGGTILAIFVVTLSAAIPWLIIWWAEQIHLYLKIVIEAFMCYQILSIKSLKKESMKVYSALVKGDLMESRKMVSMIVGRDVEGLSMVGITKATVETVAENTSDGTVAPMIFMALGGAPLGFLYKAINTMDSMIGYKNDNYKYFGTFAARLDDVANYLPARISAMIMILVAWMLKMDYKNAIKVFKRDRYNHASPNSAQTESVCAGALQIQLAGDACYFGKLYPKKTIGEPLREIHYDDIRQANRLLYGTAFITLILCLLGMGIAAWII